MPETRLILPGNRVQRHRSAVSVRTAGRMLMSLEGPMMTGTLFGAIDRDPIPLFLDPLAADVEVVVTFRWPDTPSNIQAFLASGGTIDAQQGRVIEATTSDPRPQLEPPEDP